MPLRFLKKPTYMPIGKSRSRLRLLLSLLVIGLILPLLFLIRQTYVQLEKESYFLQRQAAENLVEQINERAQEILLAEENRPIRDYFFLHISSLSNSAINFSPLSSHPPITGTPGVIGYFQIRSSGQLTSPLLPRDLSTAHRFGLTPSDVHQRMGVLGRVQNILLDSAQFSFRYHSKANTSANPWTMELTKFMDEVDSVARFSWVTQKMSDLEFYDPYPNVTDTRSMKSKGRQLFSRKGKVDEDALLPLLDPYSGETNPNSHASTNSALPWMPPAARAWSPPKERVLRPDNSDSQNLKSNFSFKILHSGEGLFFRDVSVSGQHYVQGFLVEHSAFLKSIFERPLEASPLADNTQLWIGYRNALLVRYSPTEDDIPRYTSSTQTSSKYPSELLVLAAGLSAPFDGFELLFSTRQLPASPAKPVVTTLALIVVLVLILGVYLIYGLALNQLEFAKQRSDFVSAVSHELKTPLTSIRMYGEMLRDGWVQDESKKKNYYDYIFFESERLSRLISNVLYLTRYTNEVQPNNHKNYTPDGLLHFIESKVTSTLLANGFELKLLVNESDLKKGQSALVRVDEDAISQIFINLVDNAVKFLDDSGLKKVDIGYRIVGDPPLKVVFFVRDYGPGVPRKDRDKIFKLFFRSGDEMTRTTAGTGMGLALVKQMADSMNAEVHYRAMHPGSEFRVEFKTVAPSEDESVST